MSPPPDGATSGADSSPREARALVSARAERWGADLRRGLSEVYGPVAAEALSTRLVDLAVQTVAARSGRLLALDVEREETPDWFQRPSFTGYAAYADRFGGDLRGVGRHIGYLRELGVSCLHLMPLLQDRPGDSDGGYAVADYRSVRADLGTNDDLAALATSLAGAGISLELDVVLNHVAAEHAWARAARDGDPFYRGFFHCYPDRTLPDEYEKTLLEVFPFTAPGNFTWVEEMQAWVWTSFNSFQWDLNWSNPEVFHAFAGIIAHLANLGVEVLRLDAIAFLWKRLGTISQNQPEVHSITRALRAFARIACPTVVFNAEAIVGPSDLLQYLGSGGNEGKVCDFAYHNSLMVHVWSMLATREVGLAAHALGRLPVKPPQAGWVTYIRCHDDIGWAVDDSDAAAVGLSGPLHRAFLAGYYSGAFPGSYARGVVFQENPATGDRRNCGMTASLAGLEAAGDDPASVGIVIDRILLAHSIVLGWGGLCMIWMGDEIGLGNDVDWAHEPGHETDNRWIHRPHMDWSRADLRHDPQSVPGRLFAGLSHLIRCRAGLPQMHGSIDTEVLEVADRGVLAVRRPHPDGDLLGVYNVTEEWRPYPSHLVAAHLTGPWTDELSGQHIHPGEDGNLWLAPYRALWLRTG